MLSAEYDPHDLDVEVTECVGGSRGEPQAVTKVRHDCNAVLGDFPQHQES
jgi:hypothetical protein